MQIMTNYANMPVRYNRISEQPTTATQPIPSPQPTTTSKTTFKGGKQEVIYSGMFKKYTEQAKKVLDTVKQDSNVMDFIKKYSDRVILYTDKDATHVSSHIRIEYSHPYETFWNKVKNAISNEPSHVIDISGFGTDIYHSTHDLCKNCEKERGCLGSHVKMHLETINELKVAKDAKIAHNAKKQADKIAMEQEMNKSKAELDKTIDEFFK